MQCEVTPSRRSPQLALLIVVSLAVMAITGSFVKQQNEIDRQADEIRSFRAWRDLIDQRASPGRVLLDSMTDLVSPSVTGTITGTGLTTVGRSHVGMTTTIEGELRLGNSRITDDGERLCIGHVPDPR